MELSKEQIQVLEHTIYQAAGGLYCGEDDDVKTLCKLGMMEPAGRKSFVPDPYFRVTNLGREYLRCPKKESIVDA